MKQKEKNELWEMIEMFSILNSNTQNYYKPGQVLCISKEKEMQQDFDNLYKRVCEYFDAIEPEDMPHNFTPDVINVQNNIDSRSNIISRLKLNHYSLCSLLVDNLDELSEVIPHKQKLKQFAENYNKLLQNETSTGYKLANDKELHFSQWQNLIKLGNNIFIKAVKEGKAHEYLSFLIAFNNDACKYEITDIQFDIKNVDEQAKNELSLLNNK